MRSILFFSVITFIAVQNTKAQSNYAGVRFPYTSTVKK
jgi:hypothetical protein